MVKKINNFGVYIEIPLTSSRWIDSGTYISDNMLHALPIGRIVHSNNRHYMDVSIDVWKEWRQSRINKLESDKIKTQISLAEEEKKNRAHNYTYPVDKTWIKSDIDLSRLSTEQLSMGTIISTDGQYVMFVEPNEWNEWKNWYEHQPHIIKQKMQQSIKLLENLINNRTALIHERMIQEAKFLIELKDNEIKSLKNKKKYLKAKQTREKNRREEIKLEEKIKKAEEEKNKLQKNERELRASRRSI